MEIDTFDTFVTKLISSIFSSRTSGRIVGQMHEKHHTIYSLAFWAENRIPLQCRLYRAQLQLQSQSPKPSDQQLQFHYSVSCNAVERAGGRSVGRTLSFSISILKKKNSFHFAPLHFRLERISSKHTIIPHWPCEIGVLLFQNESRQSSSAATMIFRVKSAKFVQCVCAKAGRCICARVLVCAFSSIIIQLNRNSNCPELPFEIDCIGCFGRNRQATHSRLINSRTNRNLLEFVHWFFVISLGIVRWTSMHRRK